MSSLYSCDLNTAMLNKLHKFYCCKLNVWQIISDINIILKKSIKQRDKMYLFTLNRFGFPDTIILTLYQCKDLISQLKCLI